MTENPVTKTFWGRAPLDSGAALFYYQKHSIVQQLLHALKYKNRSDVAAVFGSEIGEMIREKAPITEIQALVPVPMHPSKMKTRGYNQSELLANHIAQALDKPVVTTLLRKEWGTGSQTKKGRFDRWTNSQENFVSIATDLRHIALVDDVITTGATLEACVQALHKHNPELKVSVIALAYTYR